MNRPTFAAIMLLPLSAAAAPSHAESNGPPPSFTAAAKFGGAFPGIFSGLEAAPQVQLEAGALVLDGRVDADLVFGYQQPPASGGGEDPRLSAGDYSWTIDQQIISVGLLGRYRFTPVDLPLRWYALLSPKAYLMQTTTTGESGGESLGENRQYDAELAVEVGVGAELDAGPGAALAELDLTFGGLVGKITGDVPSSSAGLLLGYRIGF